MRHLVVTHQRRTHSQRGPAKHERTHTHKRTHDRPASLLVASVTSVSGVTIMFVARCIAADHKDLIHDVSYDFHGRRMATCSSDQSVKVTAGIRRGAGS